MTKYVPAIYVAMSDDLHARFYEKYGQNVFDRTTGS